MSIGASHRYPCVGGLLAGAAALLVLAGCARERPRPAAQVAETPAQVAGQQPAPRKDPGGPLSAEDVARLNQPFKDAVLLEPPTDSDLRPPDLTCTGKNVAKLFQTIAGKDNKGGLWDQVQLVGPQNKAIRYRAVLTTPLGEIHIDLYPEAAPNHVRSFIALAKAGYFDGLPIYRSVRETEGEIVSAYVESGCPKGTGEVGYGSIGYWLKPEIQGNPLIHEAGAVGAWHLQELESAACRFYITAEKMPQMDGAFTVFGKVSRGLDLVRTINVKPVEDKTTFRLKEPVPIQSVVIQQLEDGAVQTN